MRDQDAGITKVSTGIMGFDVISGGGLPQGRTTLLMGSPGAGKTVFALQTLVYGARHREEPGIFVTFEENSRHLIENAATFGWDLPTLENKNLFFLDARMSPDQTASGEFDLTGMLVGLQAKAQEMGAKRIVFDSIDVVLTFLDNRIAERQEIYRLHDWLSNSGMTGIITARLEGEEHAHLERYGFMQYMTDTAVVLHRRIESGVSLRGLRIIKYRGSNFEENEFPMTIGSRGIDVSVKEMTEAGYEVYDERVSTGIERLDTMLQGGFFRGSSILVTGSPGTAKSTLASAFIYAACLRGERTLYASFDEGSKEILRNMRSVGIDLQPFVDSGLLRMYSSMSESRSAEEHLLRLKNLMDEHQPQSAVVDPLSALVKPSGNSPSLSVAQRLIFQAKQRGITFLCTSLLDSPDIEQASTPINVSTIADTWLHVSYVAHGGERNRALSIIKSRGTAHSNQVRELVLSHAGITLSDVYTAGGEVLMGALRYEKEREERHKRARALAEIEAARIEFEQTEAEIAARMEALRRELATKRAAINVIESEYASYVAGQIENQQQIQVLRRADEDDDQQRGQA